MSDCVEAEKLTSLIWLQFEDPEIEKAYTYYVASQNFERIRLGTKIVVLSIFISTVVLFATVANPANPEEWSWDSIGMPVVQVLRVLIPVFVVRITPVRFLEIAITLLEVCVQNTTMLMNVFRLHRYSLIDEIPHVPMNLVWDDCNADLAIHSRDLMSVCLMLTLQVAIRALARVRSKTSWIAPVCGILSFGVKKRVHYLKDMLQTAKYFTAAVP